MQQAAGMEKSRFSKQQIVKSAKVKKSKRDTYSKPSSKSSNQRKQEETIIAGKAEAGEIDQ